MDRISLEQAVEEMHDMLDEISDSKTIAQWYKWLCWEDSWLDDDEIVVNDPPE